MKAWHPDKGFGFVTDGSGEDFHFSRKSLVYPEDDALLGQPGAQLAFRTAEPLREGQFRRAVTALVIGSDADGRITHVNRERRFAFIGVGDDFGHEIDVGQAAEAEGANGKETGDRRTILEEGLAMRIDRKPEEELIRHGKAGGKQALHQRRR